MGSWYGSSWSGKPNKKSCFGRYDGEPMLRGTKWKKAGRHDQADYELEWATNILEFADTVSTTCEGQHVHASGTSGRVLTAMCAIST